MCVCCSGCCTAAGHVLTTSEPKVLAAVLYVQRLQVWNGHVKESEHVLLDPPTAVEGFFAPQQDEARLAVAAGPQLYIYVGVKIHKKIALPFEQIHGEDEAAWCASLTPWPLRLPRLASQAFSLPGAPRSDKQEPETQGHGRRRVSGHPARRGAHARAAAGAGARRGALRALARAPRRRRRRDGGGARGRVGGRAARRHPLRHVHDGRACERHKQAAHHGVRRRRGRRHHASRQRLTHHLSDVDARRRAVLPRCSWCAAQV